MNGVAWVEVRLHMLAQALRGETRQTDYALWALSTVGGKPECRGPGEEHEDYGEMVFARKGRILEDTIWMNVKKGSEAVRLWKTNLNLSK